MGGSRNIMSVPVKFAILGFAHFHANFWADAMNQHADVELVGVWDHDTDRGQEGADKYDTRFVADLDALLAACDAVGITSETSKHADLVEAAASAGKHILLEKPMATTVADCNRIRAAVEKSDGIFMQNFPKRFDPINHELVERVQRGDFGKISMVRVRHGNYHLLELGEAVHSNWFGDPALSGGGAWIDEGIHAVDFLLWLLGEPQQVYTTISKSTLGLPLEDTALALLTYASGTVAAIATSNTLIAAEESVEIYGTKGSAIISGIDLASRDFAGSPYLKFHIHGEERGVWDGSPTEPYFRQGHFHQQGPLHFIDCILNGKDPIINVEEGRKSMVIVEAGYRAAQTGQAQQLDFA
jgi:myo-inositol 2-dehydrogenase/D-chiro-inositol 1-dehydrogenase